MEKIRLEHLLEILSEEIWLGYRLPRKGRNPSLRERLELMEKLLQRAEICGNQITFEGKGTVQTEVMAYPYFLLEEICEIVEGVSDAGNTSWKITGFERFAMLQEYIYHNDCWHFSVFVRQDGIYRKADPVFSIKDAQGRIKKTDIWGYRFSWGYPMGNEVFERESAFVHLFDLQGLCEFYYEKRIYCAFAHSLDEILNLLEEKMMELLKENEKRQAKTFCGEVIYEKEVYTYEITMDENGAGYELSDKEGNIYCGARHAFVHPSFCDKIGSCADCMKLFSLQTETAVMEELISNGKLV